MNKIFIYILSFLLVNQLIAQTPHIASYPHQLYNPETNYDEFGTFIKSGGDVNGDGFNDVLVYTGQDSPTRCEIFAGNASGFDTIPIWTITGTSSLVSAYDITGDYNNDGYDDIIISSYNFNVKCYFGGAVSPSLTPNWTYNNPFPSSNFGEAICNAGDVNNDGYDDMIIGAPLYTNVELQEGAVLLVKGSATGPEPTYSWLKEINVASSYLGSTVAGIGDVNNDGYDDVAFAAPLFNAPGPTYQNGRVYLHTGYSGGLINSASWVYTGGHEENTGFNISSGDYNGDTELDLIVGGYREVLFFNGTPPSFETVPYFSFPTPDADISSGDVNGDGFDDVLLSQYVTGWIGCQGAYEYSGKDICLLAGTSEGIFQEPVWTTSMVGDNCPSYSNAAFAGDYNGDGKSDFYIGDPKFETEASSLREGALLFYWGADFIFPEIEDWSFAFTPDYQNPYMGYDIESRGDLNGDGYDDIVLPLQHYNHSYVFYGNDSIDTTYSMIIPSLGVSSTGSITDLDCAGDVNGDGFDDCIVGTSFRSVTGVNTNDGMIHLYYGSAAGIATSPSWSFGGNQAQAKLGTKVSIIGDINGDGYDDFAAGIPYRESPTIDEGMIMIFFGSPTGPAATPSFSIEADQDYAYLGLEIEPAGDVNNDGYDDMIVGIPNYDVSCTDNGVAYVFFGAADGFTEYPNWVHFYNDCFALTGYAVAGDVDINNDGYDDILIGSPQAYGTGSTNGIVDLFLGSPDGPGYYPDWSISGEAVDDELGYSVSGVPDFNGDGFDDFIIGSPYIDLGSEPQGAALLFFGGESLPLEPAQHMFRATRNTNYAGIIMGGGDQNGDGLGDFFICESEYSDTDDYLGKIYGYWGELIGCDTISDMFAGSITDSSAVISWTAVAGVSTYNLRWRLLGMGTWNEVSVTGTSHLLADLTICSTYEYQLQTICDIIPSEWTTIENFTTTCPPVCAAPPTGLYVDNITPTSAKAHWDPVYGATKYKVYYKLTTSPTWLSTNATTTSKTISGLTPGSTYLCKVKAICTGASTGYSSVVSFSTLLKTADEIKSKIALIPNPNDGRFTLSGLNSFSGEITIMMHNTLGETVFQDAVQSIENYAIDLPELQKGCYFISIADQHQSQTITMIVQ